MWQSDGTEEGTSLVRDIVPGQGGSFPFWVTALGDRVAFTATTDDAGEEPWISDGSEAGTVPLGDLNPGPEGSVPTFLTAADGAVYMSADTPDHRRELWRTDRTAVGTARCARSTSGRSTRIRRS